jgi:hypothetical protein
MTIKKSDDDGKSNIWYVMDKMVKIFDDSNGSSVLVVVGGGTKTLFLLCIFRKRWPQMALFSPPSTRLRS